jgi:hypothetical protein
VPVARDLKRLTLEVSSLSHACNDARHYPSNAYWVVSVNHHAASSAFREPPPRGKADLSSRIRFRAIVFAVNSGYRTRYPHVAVVTNRSAGREEGPALKGRHDRIYRYTATANESCPLLLWRIWEYLNKRDPGLIFKSVV